WSFTRGCLACWSPFFACSLGSALLAGFLARLGGRFFGGSSLLGSFFALGGGNFGFSLFLRRLGARGQLLLRSFQLAFIGCGTALLPTLLKRLLGVGQVLLSFCGLLLTQLGNFG